MGMAVYNGHGVVDELSMSVLVQVMHEIWTRLRWCVASVAVGRGELILYALMNCDTCIV